MTFEDFDKYQESLIKQVVEMKDTKGKEYANSESRFANFDRLAAELECPRLMVAWIYTKKHLDSISSYVKNGKEFSTEKIEGRIVDAITYLTLIAGMIVEEQELEVTQGHTNNRVISQPRIIERIVANNIDETKCPDCQEIFKSGERIIKLSDGVFRHLDNCPKFG